MIEIDTIGKLPGMKFMKQILYSLLIFLCWLFAVCLLSACNSRGVKQIDQQSIDNIIRFGDSVENLKEVSLSEIADSIQYIPIESRKECLINRSGFSFTSPYITVNQLVFDWNGRFVRKIGQKGQGPCEDSSGYLYVLFKDDYFYSKGQKLIEYDSLGQCTGKEKQLYVGAELEIASGLITMPVAFIQAEQSFAIYDYPDSIFLLDRNFNIVGSNRVIDPGSSEYLVPPGHQLMRYITFNGEKSLFYNAFNDTVFEVKSQTLIPKWIINMGKYKVPNEIYLDRYGVLLEKAAESYKNGSLDKCELVQATDNKKRILSVSETDDYLFFMWATILEFAESRGLENTYPQVAYYNKHTGELVAVKGHGFIDDIHKGAPFLPLWGAWKNKLISSIWPYELKEYIEKQQNEGKEVAQELLRLSERVEEEANPILIVVYLKTYNSMK